MSYTVLAGSKRPSARALLVSLEELEAEEGAWGSAASRCVRQSGSKIFDPSLAADGGLAMGN